MFWLYLLLLTSTGSRRKGEFEMFWLCLIFFPFMVLSDLLKMNK